MPFRSGQFLVHPAHGLLRVDRIVQRRVRATEDEYLDLVAVSQQLRISVPVARLTDVGIRSPITAEQVEELLEVLRGPSSADRLSWSRRLKDFQLRAASGALVDRCVVIREIARAGVRAPATAEGMLLRSTRTLLASEFAAVLGVTTDDAGALIDAAAHSETTRRPPLTRAAVRA